MLTGLATRHYGNYLPAFVAEYAGDAILGKAVGGRERNICSNLSGCLMAPRGLFPVELVDAAFRHECPELTPTTNSRIGRLQSESRRLFRTT